MVRLSAGLSRSPCQWVVCRTKELSALHDWAAQVVALWSAISGLARIDEENFSCLTWKHVFNVAGGCPAEPADLESSAPPVESTVRTEDSKYTSVVVWSFCCLLGKSCRLRPQPLKSASRDAGWAWRPFFDSRARSCRSVAASVIAASTFALLWGNRKCTAPLFCAFPRVEGRGPAARRRT